MEPKHPIKAYVGILVYLFGFIALVLNVNDEKQDSLIWSSFALMAIGCGVALQPEKE